MLPAKIIRLLALLALAALYTDSAFPQSLSADGARTPEQYGVVVQGSLPGIAAKDVPAYVLRQLTTLYAPSRRFVLETSSVKPLYRMSWTFRLLPSAAGTVRSIGPGPAKLPFSVRCRLTISAQVTKGDIVQTEVAKEMPIREVGPGSADLSDAVGSVASALIPWEARVSAR